jgi:hypothetical protein
MHIKSGVLQFIAFNTNCDSDTAHYIWGSTTYSLLHSLWRWYCTLNLGIYNLFRSTPALVVKLHITAGDIQLIPFNTVCGFDSAHYVWGSKSFSLQHSLWWWYCTLHLGICNLFPSTLSVVVILDITVSDQELIIFNTVYNSDIAYYGWGSTPYSFQHPCGDDTAHYGWGSTTYFFQHSLWYWYCTLKLTINNLLPSKLSAVNILHITAGEVQLIAFNTVCGDDTARNSFGSATYSVQHCLWIF